MSGFGNLLYNSYVGSTQAYVDQILKGLLAVKGALIINEVNTAWSKFLGAMKTFKGVLSHLVRLPIAAHVTLICSFVVF